MAGVTTSAIWNIPNGITAVRLAVTLVLFAALHWHSYRIALILFMFAALTDWVDGFLARRWNQVTQLGRILDPIADKLLICGTFVFLAAVAGSGIDAWIAVVVLGRELMITVVRSFLEQHGRDFSAQASGKWKMVVQCLTAIVALARLSEVGSAFFGGLGDERLVRGLAWGTAAITTYSGLVYLPSAARLVRGIGAER